MPSLRHVLIAQLRRCVQDVWVELYMNVRRKFESICAVDTIPLSFENDSLLVSFL